MAPPVMTCMLFHLRKLWKKCFQRLKFLFGTKVQGWAKVGLHLWVHETQSLFLYYYLFLCYIFLHTNHCKPTFAHPYIILNFLLKWWENLCWMSDDRSSALHEEVKLRSTSLPWNDGCSRQAEVTGNENWTETMGFGQQAVTGYLFKRVFSLEQPNCGGLRKESGKK